MKKLDAYFFCLMFTLYSMHPVPKQASWIAPLEYVAAMFFMLFAQVCEDD